MAPAPAPRLAFPRLALVGLVAALALAGCGRKGPLELPPAAPGTPTPTASDASVARTQAKIDDPALIQPPNKSYQTPSAEQIAKKSNKPVKPINGPPTVQGKPFVLDPLL